MRKGLHSRALLWMAIISLPFLLIGSFAITEIERGLEAKLGQDLNSTGRLEVARIEETLALSALFSDEILESGAIRPVFAGVLATRDEQISAGDIPFPPAIAPEDPGLFNVFLEEPLGRFVRGASRRLISDFSPVRDFAIFTADGENLGQTTGFSWDPSQSLIDQTLSEGETQFGDAFEALNNSPRFAIVVPIEVGEDEVALGFDEGEIIGVAVMETDLWSTGFTLGRYAEFAEGTEAYLTQPLADGATEVITPLQAGGPDTFERLDQAHEARLGAAAAASTEQRVFRALDYRGVDSLISVQTIESTGWNLVIKVDSAETLGPIENVRRAGLTAVIATTLLVILCTALMIRPLLTRLRRLSEVSGEIAGGSYQARINDDSRDEVGDVARSIDAMAEELERDIRIREDAAEQLRGEARRDHLTGIYNRQVALEAMNELAETADEAWSVLFVDLDGFKPVNDYYGHEAGDEVLRLFARHLTASAPKDATVARWGGDEFLVVLPNSDSKTAGLVTARLKKEMTEHLDQSQWWIPGLGWSVGIANAAPGEDDVASVIRKADERMLDNKPAGNRRNMASNAESAMSQALTEGRIEVFYQPVVNLAEGIVRTTGAEALVRMRDSEGKLVSPGAFLPAIIDSEVGADLDRFVISEATRTLADWIDREVFPESFQMAVNLGAASLSSPVTADYIARSIETAGIPANQLVVEVSESAAAVDQTILARLKALGIEVSIDDVGLELSNIDRLIDLEPTYAKLDKRWLLCERERKAGVLKHLLHMVWDLGLIPIVEGVEGPTEAQLMLDLGVGFAQGYHYGRPVPKAEFELAVAVDPLAVAP